LTPSAEAEFLFYTTHTVQPSSLVAEEREDIPEVEEDGADHIGSSRVSRHCRNDSSRQTSSAGMLPEHISVERVMSTARTFLIVVPADLSARVHAALTRDDRLTPQNIPTQ